MTRSQALAALRRALVPAVLVAGLVLALVLAVLMTRGATYESRVSLVATPVAELGAERLEFGAVVSVVMPAIPEVAVSTGVLDRLQGGPAGALTAEELASSVAVELVPASGVARITVTTDDAAQSSSVLQAIVAEVRQGSLLSPVGRFLLIGSTEVPPTQVRPDSTLALGLAILAAGTAGLLAVAAVQVLRPVLLTVSDVERVVRDSTTPHVPVTSVRGANGLDLLSAHLMVGAPGVRSVRVFTERGAGDEQLAVTVAARLTGTAPVQPSRPRFRSRRDLRPPEPPVQAPAGAQADVRPLPDVRPVPEARPDDQVALVTARLRRTTPDQLRATLLQAQASGLRTGAVAVR